MSEVRDIGAATRERIDQTLVTLGVVRDAGSLTVERLDGGASNENFLVHLAGAVGVLRLAASVELSDRFNLDRWRGYAAHRAAEAVGVAPALLAVSLPSGHSLVEFIDGEVLEPSAMTAGTNLEDSVRALQRVHRLDIDCGDFDALVEVERFAAIARAENLWLPDDIEDLLQLARRIGEAFQSARIPALLCHNDVQIANLIRSSDGRLRIIDWEYAGRGNPYFDLAMLANNADLDRAGTARLLTAYFGVEREPDHARIELERFRSALREAMWSVVAEPVLDTGWDFAGWARQYTDSARTVAARIESGDLLTLAAVVDGDDAIFDRILSDG